MAATPGPLARHRLAWLGAPAWADLLAHADDDEARALLAHWWAHDLPCVVTRQPAGLASSQLALGLPAPLRWSRRRQALTVARAGLRRTGRFPSLSSVAQGTAWQADAEELAQALSQCDVAVEVFGSWGWQQLSRLACARPGSDLDLRITLRSLAQARQVLPLLHGAALPMRLDGELVFPGDLAVAWRELAALLAGQTRQVLCKHLHGVALRDLPALQAHLNDHSLTDHHAEPA